MVRGRTAGSGARGPAGYTGEVVGMAAAVCRRHDAEPRAVYDKYLDELKELTTRGVGKPAKGG